MENQHAGPKFELIKGSTWFNPFVSGKREIGIFELSDLFCITTEALRKYEKKKILQPRRNKSGYRAYGSWELTKIIRTRQLRQEGFSLDAIAERISSPDFCAVKEMESMQQELLRQIEYKKKLIRWLGCQKEKQTAFEIQGDKIQIEHIPEWYCCVYMVDDALVLKEGKDREALKAWLNALPFAHVFYVGNRTQGVISCLVLSRQEIEEYGLQILKPDFIIPAQLCITLNVVAEHSESYDSSDEVLKEAFERARTMDIPLADYQIMQMVRYTQIEGVFRSYNKAIFPIKQD